jgi:cytochrome c-type biogenesis protein CcmH/NrfF
MSRQVFVLLVLLLSGCSRDNSLVAGAPGAAPVPEAAASANKYLAYEHTIAVDAEADKIGPVFESAQAACRAAASDSCAILEAQVTRGEHASAKLKFRATAKGVRDLIAMLSAQGEVASRSTSAEDLAGPIEDTAKKIAMLTDYREKLEALRGRSSADVDSLIKLTRELAQVQSELESLTGSQAALIQRVETEILNVSISSYNSRSFWSPIGNSVSDFGENLSEAIATFITALPYLIPWVLLLIFGIWIWRKLRKRKRET